MNNYTEQLQAIQEAHDPEKMTLGPIRLDYTPQMSPNLIEPKTPIAAPHAVAPGIEVNTVEDQWEIAIFDFEINSRDDVFTVGIVISVFLLVYVAKLSLDHWFNKRLEIFKNKLKSN